MPENKKTEKKITIKVYDKEYPCYPTRGAAVKFKELTGHDMEDMKGSADVASYVYCCAKSACKREKTNFDIQFDDFCDGVLLEDLNAFNAQMAEANGESDSKKKD